MNHFYPKTSQLETNGWALVTKLLKNKHIVTDHGLVQYGYRIRLGCGLVITMYQSQKILVQGSTGMQYPVGYMQELLPLLPLYTNWKIPEIEIPAVASFRAALVKAHRERMQITKN